MVLACDRDLLLLDGVLRCLRRPRGRWRSPRKEKKTPRAPASIRVLTPNLATLNTGATTTKSAITTPTQRSLGPTLRIPGPTPRSRDPTTIIGAITAMTGETIPTIHRREITASSGITTATPIRAFLIWRSQGHMHATTTTIFGETIPTMHSRGATDAMTTMTPVLTTPMPTMMVEVAPVMDIRAITMDRQCIETAARDAVHGAPLVTVLNVCPGLRSRAPKAITMPWCGVVSRLVLSQRIVGGSLYAWQVIGYACENAAHDR